MTRINQLISFCKVVEMGSFSQAGEALGLSQPTISLQVKALEEEYSTELLHREGHRILPTEDGLFVYEHSTKIIALFKRSLQGVKNNQGKYSNSIRIGASSGPGEHPIPIIIAKFKQANPECDISLQVGDSNDIMDQVANQVLEIGFVGAKRRDGSLTFQPFLEDKLILAVSKESQFAKQHQITYSELQKIPLIIQQSGSGATVTLQRALAEMRMRLSDLNIMLQLGLQDSVKAAVIAGYGATIISSLGIKKEIENGDLIPISVEDLDLSRKIHFCQNREVPLSNIAKRFIKFAQQYKNI